QHLIHERYVHKDGGIRPSIGCYFEVHRDGNRQHDTPDVGVVRRTLVEQSREEHSEYTGTHHTRVFLDELERLSQVTQRRRDEHGDNQGNQSRQPSDENRLAITSPAVDIRTINVHRKDGGGRVDHGSKRRNNGGGEGCQHQTF